MTLLQFPGDMLHYYLPIGQREAFTGQPMMVRISRSVWINAVLGRRVVTDQIK